VQSVDLRDGGWQSTRDKGIAQIVKYLYQIMHSYVDDLAQPYNEWQKSDTSVKSWTMDLKEQQYNSIYVD